MSIRWKLFLILFSLTVVAAGLVLVAAERQLRDWVKGEVERTFSAQVDGLLESRQERLENIRKSGEKFAAHPFVRADLRGEAERDLREKFIQEYLAARAGTATSRRRPEGESAGKRPPAGARVQPGGSTQRPGVRGTSSGAIRMPAMGIITLEGEIRHYGPAVAAGSRKRRERTTEQLKELSRRPSQEIAYVIAEDETKRSGIQEVVVTPVKDGSGTVFGWFFLGVDAETPVERAFQQAEEATGREARTGLVVDDMWFVRGVTPELSVALAAALPGGFWQAGEPAAVSAMGQQFLVIARDLNPDSPLGKGYQVGVFPIDALISAVGRLRTTSALIGGVVVLLAGVSAFLLAERICRPVGALVAATERVRRGDFKGEVPVQSKDELGTLATAFNTMTKDLALKERYREVLGKVSDPSVAEQLMEGKLELGGEVRKAAVLFCDIRGFTSMTEGMDPAGVIELLNEHMIVMTKVVHDHGGVVDKFVGDLVMALFGVPLSGEDDAERAAGCALAMLTERARLDAATGRAVPVGIGVAYGELVAGCMGSEDRLNYTVLGERVNLASRLCSAAKPGEILIDGTLAAVVGETHRVEERAPISLRGFSGPVPVFALVDRQRRSDG